MEEQLPIPIEELIIFHLYLVNATKPKLIKWAINMLISWSNKSIPIEPIRIHGTNDRLIPLKGKALEIKNGGHFMIVDKAEEISNVINEQMKYSG